METTVDAGDHLAGDPVVDPVVDPAKIQEKTLPENPPASSAAVAASPVRATKINDPPAEPVTPGVVPPSDRLQVVNPRPRHRQAQRLAVRLRNNKTKDVFSFLDKPRT